GVRAKFQRRRRLVPRALGEGRLLSDQGLHAMDTAGGCSGTRSAALLHFDAPSEGACARSAAMRYHYTLLVVLPCCLFTAARGEEPDKEPAGSSAKSSGISEDPNDWPMYNRDVIGTRYNSAEKVLGRDNVGKLIERWRFPAEGSRHSVGI